MSSIFIKFILLFADLIIGSSVGGVKLRAVAAKQSDENKHNAEGNAYRVVKMHIHCRILGGIQKSCDNTLCDTAQNCTAGGNGSGEDSETHKLLRAGNGKRSACGKLILKIYFRKFSHNAVAGAYKEPAGQRGKRAVNIVTEFVGKKSVQRYSADFKGIAAEIQADKADDTAAKAD